MASYPPLDRVVAFPPTPEDRLRNVCCRGRVQQGLLFSKFKVRTGQNGPRVSYPCRGGHPTSGPPDRDTRRVLDALILRELRRQGYRLDAPRIRRSDLPSHATGREEGQRP